MLIRTLALAACSLAVTAPLRAEAPAPVDYNRQIRPLLSNNCFACHGPDEGNRQAGLRLDRRDAAIGETESGITPIVPGKPEASEVIARITAADESLRMPPADSGKTLTDEQQQLLARWIAEGAEYREHWSFVPPARTEPPTVADPSWPRGDIDCFVLARLQEAGASPSPEADRTTLIRRLSLDLTGLPPTPEEVDAFVADDRPDAYATLVERLLASPHYGERMALDWLDASRFADTHGFHIDSGRDMTRWREWVIDAFNNNLPFDEFTVDQLAGDLLPGATLEQQIASGFNRNHMINFEGGAIPQEYHTAYIIDRVNTTATVWLGLTVGCCQCHDHKYDPLSQREYYQFFAFFHNVPENGLDGREGNATPLLKVPTPDQEREQHALDAEIAGLQSQLAGPLPEVDAEQAAWEAEYAATRGAITWQGLEPVASRSTGGATLTPQADQSLLASGERPVSDVYEITLRTDAVGITALQLVAASDPSLPGGGPGRFDNGNFVLGEFEIDAVSLADPTQSQSIRLARAEADYSQQGYEIAQAIDGKPETGWAVDGPTKHETRTANFYPAEPFGFAGGTEIRVRLRFETPIGGHSIGRPMLSLTTTAAPSMKGGPPKKVAKALETLAAERTPEQLDVIRKWYREEASARTRQLNDQLTAARERRKSLDKQVRSVMVMQEMPQPRDTFILMRGQYDKPGDKVTAGVPAVLPALPADAPRNRLGLARWLVDPANPLVARVIVNRYWQMYFGTGLVKTSEDFGSQGEQPSHPALLDWLAAEFVASGWDVKHMQRLIVTSATYRQASTFVREKHAADPENRLLARASRFRLPAEFIRDGALSVSGLLDGRIGGASVSPYQPPGLWEELAYRDDGKNWTAQSYTQSHGADLYRRTMYTFWKRTSPPPTLSTFDAPDRETCTVRRSRTNTPLQALILMNDPTYVEASRKLAERLLASPAASIDDRLTLAFRLATARHPSERELAVLRRVYEDQLAAFRAKPEAAAELLKVGESPRSESFDAAELAAWTLLSSVVLNLDETITRG